MGCVRDDTKIYEPLTISIRVVLEYNSSIRVSWRS